jgi:hypothetical protein
MAMLMPSVADRQQSFVTYADAPVVAVEKPRTDGPTRLCLDVRTWGKVEEIEARSWLRRIVSNVGTTQAAVLTGIDEATLVTLADNINFGPVRGELVLNTDMPAARPVVTDEAREVAARARDLSRSRRKREVRPKTTSVKRLTKTEIEVSRVMYPARELALNDAARPKTRGECEAARGYDENGKQNPCGFVACRYHLAIDVDPKTGSVREVFPDLDMDVTLMPETCVLDVSERDGCTLEEAGEYTGVVRERIRQLETVAMGKILASGVAGVARDLLEVGERVRGRVHLRVIQGGRPAPEVETETDEDEDSDEAEG